MGIGPFCIPFDRLLGTARDGQSLGNRVQTRLVREVVLEDGPEEEVLPGPGRVVWESNLPRVPHIVADHPLRVLLQPVHPVVSNTVRKLLLLSPEHLLGEERILRHVKRLAQHVLLQLWVGAVRLGLEIRHLLPGIHRHREIQKGLVKERHPRLDSKGKRCLVGPHDVKFVQPLHQPDAFLVVLLGTGGLVEVQISAQLLVSPLPGQNNLDAQRLDLPRQQEHRDGGADLLVRLDVIHQLVQGVDSLLHRERELVVVRPEEISHLAGGLEVRRPLDADGKGVHLVVTVKRIFRILDSPDGDRGHQRRIQPPGEEHRKRRIGHQPLLDGRDERLPNLVKVGSLVPDVGLVDPHWVVPPLQLPGRAPVDVTRRKRIDPLALGLQGLHLTGEPGRTVLPLAPVQAANAHRVPCRHERVGALVPDDAGEDSVQTVPQVVRLPVLVVQMADDGRVRLGRVLHPRQLRGADILVVVDLAVQSPVDVSLRRLDLKRLVSARARIDDTETLKGDEGFAIGGLVDTARVRPSVAQDLREL
mmetsp:Transcript_14861/g.42369  ORF Transcript_14861/g.42369 Transcript_14861/m.42369 type:complete len:531 (+) Transcript_14861:157-1749(+)